MKIKIPGLKPRNPYAEAANKRHAGAHDKSEKIKRRNAKQALKLALKQGRDDFPPFFFALPTVPAAIHAGNRRSTWSRKHSSLARN
ncbi:MAG: hypothetical protein JO218_04005 [Burkholderiales bacterium]|nr:hypothetical protein [Burkholderiales bacterium]